MMKKKMLWCAILLSLAVPQVFASLSLVTTSTSIFGPSQACVVSTVEWNDVTNMYRYTYTISNATEKFTSFIVAIDPSAVITNTGYSSLVSSWVETDDNDALVATIIGNLKTSGATVTVWFECADSYTTGDAALANVKTYAQGSVLTAVPEPMTLVLLGLGGIAMARSSSRKR